LPAANVFYLSKEQAPEDFWRRVRAEKSRDELRSHVQELENLAAELEELAPDDAGADFVFDDGTATLTPTQQLRQIAKGLRLIAYGLSLMFDEERS
jgi:hypothetical protein